MSTEKYSLEKSLQAYRVLHTPTQFSVKQHWANETFEHDRYNECTEEEKAKCNEILSESKITYAQNIRSNNNCSIITLKDLVDKLTDTQYKSINKQDRHVIYTSDNGERPIGKHAFDIWGGFQVIDMDIKDKEIAEYLKSRLFCRLKKYNWFLGVVTSSSGKGLHVYTKIQVPQDMDLSKKKLLYLTNFRHKYSFVYLASIKALEGKPEITKEDLTKWMDLAMFKPQQGAFIPYDEHPLINTRFFEDFIYVNFDNVEDMGHPDVDWVSHPDLKEIFKRWEWFEEDDSPAEVEVISADELTSDKNVTYHYKHFERWKLANTLVNLYGLEKGTKYLRMICSNDIKTKELTADCKTASLHKKPIDLWAVNRLNKYHGFNIKTKIDQHEGDISELYSNIDSIVSNPCMIINSKNTKTFYINKKQFLSDIKDKLIGKVDRLTLIEAGAGTGKTEMVKSLATEGKRVMMVMPFTSTIKSKVENDPKWYFSYGNRKVRFDKEPCVALTIDKFAKLNLMELKEQEFDYIFIDESHLLFQSEYRPVMPRVIEMIRNTEIPIIMMTGTPIGETIFFPDIVHLKVIKEETRTKSFKVFYTDTPDDNLLYMCKEMANDIYEGRRILFPTNKGSIYKEKIASAVKWFLENDYMYTDPIQIEYYKKANIGEEFMDDVNFKKTIKNVNILLCSTFLSVGVDILDKLNFSVYFNELWMPQEIEQFANRLRNRDLYIKLFINKKDNEGNSLNIYSYKPLNTNTPVEEIKDAQSIIRLCNGMIERNPIEYKYNSLISSIINENKFIDYNAIENKYYLNEIAYKTVIFEHKYRDYVQQLPVLCRGMQFYGYEFSSEDKGAYPIGEDAVMVKECLKEAKDFARASSTEHIHELLNIITESRLPIYYDVMQGKYSIRKGKEWKEDREKKVMTVKDIEVFEKVVPLFVSMSKMYDIEDIKDIFNFCRDSKGYYNFSAINRIRLLINIIYNDKKERLDIPIKKFMSDSYDFVNDHKENGGCTKVELANFIKEKAADYAIMESTNEIIIMKSPLTIEKIERTLLKIFRALIDVGRSKKGVMPLRLNELLWTPKEDKKTKEFVNDNLFILGDFLDQVTIDTNTK